MQWYNYLGWMLVGVFILFFGVGMFRGIDKSQELIPTLMILLMAVGLILVNKH
jgi:NhaP-type Na+/H+ or K+/H+ antiporter